MSAEQYPKIVPDPQVRTALSGCLGRRFWDIASKSIWEAMEDAEVMQACSSHDDLIDACEGLIAAARRAEPVGGMIWQNAISIARAAITKATIEQEKN